MLQEIWVTETAFHSVPECFQLEYCFFSSTNFLQISLFFFTELWRGTIYQLFTQSTQLIRGVQHKLIAVLDFEFGEAFTKYMVQINQDTNV